DRLHPDASELHAIAVGERRERVLGLRFRAKVNRRAGAIAQLEMSRDEVRMQMREEDVADGELVLVREREITIDVALWIDDRGGSRRFIADEVRRVRQTIEVKLLEDHRLESAHYGEVYTRRVPRPDRCARRRVHAARASRHARRRDCKCTDAAAVDP